jgi:antitoxin VapB
MSAINTTAKTQNEAVSTPAPAPRTAKLFKNGRSQAVRLPKEFRFEGTEVAVRWGNASGEVILSEPPIPKKSLSRELFENTDRAGFLEGSVANLQTHRPRSSWEERFAVWDALGSPDDDVLERDPTPPVERDFF